MRHRRTRKRLGQGNNAIGSAWCESRFEMCLTCTKEKEHPSESFESSRGLKSPAVVLATYDTSCPRIQLSLPVSLLSVILPSPKYSKAKTQIRRIFYSKGSNHQPQQIIKARVPCMQRLFQSAPFYGLTAQWSPSLL